MQLTTVWDLADRYQVVLFDAFGVLVNNQGAYPGAGEFIACLNSERKPYFVLTNDAARLPWRLAEKYAAAGLAISAERIISSGMLLKGYFQDHALRGARCLVLGTEDSAEFVRQAGGEVVPLVHGQDAEVVVVGDEDGFDFLPGLSIAMSLIIRRIEKDQAIHLVLPNPDLIFPVGGGEFSFAAGSMAAMLERGVAARFAGTREISFTALGKPHRTIFDVAAKSSGTLEMVMIGDQLVTDIQGANDFGIASALTTFGVTDVSKLPKNFLPKPNYQIASFARCLS